MNNSRKLTVIYYATVVLGVASIVYSCEAHATEPYVSATIESSDEFRAPDPMARAEIGINFDTEHIEFDVFSWHKSSVTNVLDYRNDRETVNGIGARIRWEPFR